MKIDQLQCANFIVHRRATFDFRPMTVIAGPNGSGKTSVRDGLRFAMLGGVCRVDAKGDREKLISEGADAGTVTLTCGDATIVRDIKTAKLRAAAALPIGEDSVKEAVDCLFEQRAFAARGEGERRRELLIRLMRVAMGPEAIVAELEQRGHATDLLAKLPQAEPLAAWVKLAETSASEARGAWKAVAGETYGAVKAETWSAPAAAEPPAGAAQDAREAVAAARFGIEILNRDLGAYDAAARAGTVHSGQIEMLRRRVDHLPVLRERVAEAEAAKTAAEAAATKSASTHEYIKAHLPPKHYDCPECGSAVALLPTGLAKCEIPKNASTHDQESAAFDAMQEARDFAAAKLAAWATEQRALDAATEAQQMLNELVRAVAPDMPIGNREDLVAEIDDARIQLEKLEAALSAATAQVSAHKAATERTTKAAAHHAAVKAWLKLAADLAPDGIPGDLLARALDPFNATLRDQAAATNWRTPMIDAGMQITAGGRPYALLSQSEKWRVDAILSVAVAIHSGLRFVILDRFDELEVAARRGALGWLYGLTKTEALDSVVVLATLQAAPQVPADVGTIWLGEAPAERAAPLPASPIATSRPDRPSTPTRAQSTIVLAG
jgi:hypothetical protein